MIDADVLVPYRHYIYQTLLGQEGRGTERPVSLIMIDADVVAPHRHQAISNHHADSTETIVVSRDIHITVTS